MVGNQLSYHGGKTDMHAAKETFYTTNIENVWEQALSAMNKRFGDASYKSWISHLTFQEFRSGEIILTAPSRFIREWILNNYYAYLVEQLSKLNPQISRVEIKVKANRAKTTPKCIINDNFIAASAQDESKEKCDIFTYNLDPRYNFDNFIAGCSNRIPLAAARAVAEDRDADSIHTNTNILFIKSPVGMGKTHIMQAIASHIKANQPHKKVAYLSADKFVYVYLKAIRNNALVEFKEKLRSADMLLIDDLQFICGKTATQQEFLNTLTALTDSNKKVVITCDVSPYNLNLDKRSISKLAGGLVVGIKPSDLDLRMKLLKAKAEQYTFLHIPDEVIELIANNVIASNRELEAALNKLITHSGLGGFDITIQAAKEILKDNFSANSQEISVEKIMKIVADFYDVKIDDITSKSRAGRFIMPRQVSAYLAKQLTKVSLQDIGFKLGGRDHATVLYSVKKLEKALTQDKKLAQDVAKIIDHLGFAH